MKQGESHMARHAKSARKESEVNAAVLPKAIQAQVEEADRLQASLTDGAAPPEGTPAPEPDPTPAPQPAAQEAPVPREETAEYWKHRFEVMQGKFNAETPQLHAQLKELAEANKALTATVQQLTQPKATPQEAKPLVTSEDEDKFGSDLIDAMRRVVRDEMGSLSARLAVLEKSYGEVATKVQKVDKVERQVAATVEETFYAQLKAAVPDWETVNKDPQWLQWLAEVDPILGRQRQTLLDDASGSLDVRRVAAIFNAFKGVQPQTQASQAKAELARQVAPSRSTTASAPPQAAKVYTEAQWKYWMDPRRRHDTDPKQLATMQAEIEAAFAEGRVQF